MAGIEILECTKDYKLLAKSVCVGIQKMKKVENKSIYVHFLDLNSKYVFIVRKRGIRISVYT